MKNNLDQLIRSTIDLHVHMGPEIIPRKYNSINRLVNKLEGRITGVALKNHFYPTVPLIVSSNTKGLKLIGSIVLNNFIGGLNPEAVYAMSLISKDPFIVWFPTISSKNFLKRSEYEIPIEWVQKRFESRTSTTVKGISILEGKNRINRKARQVLQAIKKSDAILATGHISWREAKILAESALELGIKKIILTHPIYQRIAMPLEEQIKLVNKGCFIEICYSMYSIDDIPISSIANQIKTVGYKNIVLSSDVGQAFSPDPDKAMRLFAEKLFDCGITLTQLERMMVKNPLSLLK